MDVEMPGELTATGMGRLYGYRTEYPEHAVVIRDTRIHQADATALVGIAVGKDYRHANRIAAQIRADFPHVDTSRVPILNPQVVSLDSSRLSIAYDDTILFIGAVARGRVGNPQFEAAKLLSQLGE